MYLRDCAVFQLSKSGALDPIDSEDDFLAKLITTLTVVVISKGKLKSVGVVSGEVGKIQRTSRLYYFLRKETKKFWISIGLFGLLMHQCHIL